MRIFGVSKAANHPFFLIDAFVADSPSKVMPIKANLMKADGFKYLKTSRSSRRWMICIIRI